MFPTWRGRYTCLLVTFVQTEKRRKEKGGRGRDDNKAWKLKYPKRERIQFLNKSIESFQMINFIGSTPLLLSFTRMEKVKAREGGYRVTDRF